MLLERKECVCVCVCVFERARESEIYGKRDQEREIERKEEK